MLIILRPPNLIGLSAAKAALCGLNQPPRYVRESLLSPLWSQRLSNCSQVIVAEENRSVLPRVSKQGRCSLIYLLPWCCSPHLFYSPRHSEVADQHVLSGAAVLPVEPDLQQSNAEHSQDKYTMPARHHKAAEPSQSGTPHHTQHLVL